MDFYTSWKLLFKMENEFTYWAFEFLRLLFALFLAWECFKIIKHLETP